AWFDNLSEQQVMKYWQDAGSGKLRGALEVIKEKIRHPGGLHEWLKVSQTPLFKKWGVSMQTIKDARSPISSVIGKGFRHGSKGSGIMHRELDEMFKRAK